MNQRALHYYEFGPFRLNATERLLQRGSDVVPLTPKVFDTLLVLVENCGHVLEKTELMEQLWPDSFVEESSLTQNISLLRRALSDLGGDENYIETIPKRGYRFVGAVQEREELTNGNGSTYGAMQSSEPSIVSELSSHAVVPANKSRTYFTPLAGIVFVTIVFGVFGVIYWFRHRNTGEGFAPRSVAVLPFKTIGTNGDDDLLGLGMADAMILKLSRLDQLTVLPTSSIFRFTNNDRDPVAIGKELGVEGVLDGTVQRDGDWVRVTAQLIRLRDGKTVWTGKFDERYNSIFTLQDSISDQISSSLRPQVAGDKKTKAAHPTENTEAYQAYLTGLFFWNRRTRENLPKAIDYLKHAVSYDPNFAEAHAILADCYYLTLTDEYGAPPDDALKQARTSVAKAVELDDSLAEAHTVKAGIKLLERNFDEAGQEFRRALELNPNYAVAHLRYAYYLFSTFKLDDALVHMRRAQELDPVSSVTNGALAGMLYNARDFDGSITYSKRALDLEPTAIGARVNLGEAYLQKRMFNEAHEAFDKIREESPYYCYWEKAYAYAMAGRRDDVSRMLVEVEKHNAERERMHYNYALVYGALGEKDKAFAEMELMRIGPFRLAAMKFDPQFDPLRDDSRFKDYLKKHGVE